jgi:hypothetical protein
MPDIVLQQVQASNTIQATSTSFNTDYNNFPHSLICNLYKSGSIVNPLKQSGSYIYSITALTSNTICPLLAPYLCVFYNFQHKQ